MNAKYVIFLLAAAIMLLSTFIPHTACAVELSVRKNDATCVSTTTPPCFTSIQGAIDYANNIITSATITSTTFSIQVEAETYSEAITLGAWITSLKGRETAGTILTGNGSGTLITVSGGNPSISNFTFVNATTGINIISGAIATIKNNIFNLPSGTAVLITQSTAQTSITHNTFYANTVAISTSIDLAVKNNIFASNVTALTPLATFSKTNITYNDFSPSNATDPWNGEQSLVPDANNNIAAVPLFVDSAIGDFHLTAGSPCISSGSDLMGAYASSTDTVPFKVSGVSALQDPATSVITVNWNQNLDYKVTGYRVWYGKTSGGPYNGTVSSGTGSNSPISVPTGTAASTYLLSGLTATVVTPGIPTGLSTSPVNNSLKLSWSPVDGASKYKVYWSQAPFDMSSLPGDFREVENETSDTIPGLTNGVTYYVAVSAITEAAYYVAVTAVYSAATYSPGMSNESAYSTEVPAGGGESKESAISEVVHDYPEALVAYPNLTNSGAKCFIATAAYGSYSAPQVRALRKFRDRYLLTNRPGSAFVRWYYEHGPVAAAYLEAHPGYKPVVRAALMPAVGAALFLTGAPLYIRIIVVLFMLMVALMILFRSFRKRLSASGGVH